MLSTLRNNLKAAADLLLQTVKWESLSQFQRKQLNTWAADGEGDEIYDWLIEATSLKAGKPQDLVRAAYA